MKPRQLKLNLGSNHKPGTKAHLVESGLVCGGALNYRKKKRPFRKGKAVHLIFRSQILSGNRSLLKSNRKRWVEELLGKKAKKYCSKLYQFSVNSNHLHLLVSFPSEFHQRDFLRDVAGTLALKIKKAFKISKEVKIWDGRPFSRVIKTKAFPFIQKYIEKNIKEASGLWPYEKRPVSSLQRILARWDFRLGIRHSVGEYSGA